jgi:hypothetical protein
LITVLCVRFGTRYGKEYVERLRNMVSRHLTVPYEFVCLTDDPTPIEGVRSIVQPNARYSRGWWHKVHMFDPSLNIRNRILYFDLDVVIHNNIDKLVQSLDNDFYGIRDFNRKFHSTWNQLNSSTMSWIGGQEQDIWLQFNEDQNAVMRRFPGDQDWIWHIAKNRIRFWNDNWIMSYKWEIRDRSEILIKNGKRNFSDNKSPNIPAECCVTVFHGEPKPQDVKDQFVIDNWR